jgi:prepilin-type N-terminal cleavage/methylation domain-containing protein
VTRKCDVKGRQGFTLMELLVVLLIIGILSTVAIRTIDATRDRGLFDKTTKEMNQLVQAIVGNPDLSYDGRRVDFGYYGDMEQLPDSLIYLLRNPGSTAWKGPYVHLTAGGDTSYLYDAWGNLYAYNPTLGTIRSGANKKYDMTVKIADSLTQLDNNMVAGTITDMNGAAPGDTSLTHVKVKFYYNNPGIHGAYVSVSPDPGGFYEFSPTSPSLGTTVPIGIHKLVASTSTESLIRYVTVLPRSKTIVDFKFTSSFWDKLRRVGPITYNLDSTAFQIQVENTQTKADTVSSLSFLPTSAQLYLREDFRIDLDHDGFPISNGTPGIGPGGTITFAPVAIAPNETQLVELSFDGFHVAPLGGDPKVRVTGKTFQFRFSDGSEITVNP